MLLIDIYIEEAKSLYLDGLSISKISKKYKCSINTTKDRLKRAEVYSNISKYDFHKNLKKTKKL